MSSIEDLTLLEARVRLASIHRSFLSRYGRNPLIGLDLDGTTADLVAGLREVMSSVWGLSDEERADPSRLPEPDKYAMWEGEKAWFKDKGEFLLHFRQAEGEGIYRTLPVYAEAGKTLRELKTSGFNITIVTARHQEYSEDTMDWVKGLDLPLKDILHAGVEKHLVSEVDLFIDDAPHVIEGLIANGRKVIIYDQIYNRHIKAPRIMGWNLNEVTLAIECVLRSN